MEEPCPVDLFLFLKEIFDMFSNNEKGVFRILKQKVDLSGMFSNRKYNYLTCFQTVNRFFCHLTHDQVRYGNFPILPVCIKVIASKSSSSVPTPPGRTIKP